MNVLSRRDFGLALAGALLGARAYGATAEAHPIRAVTRGPKFHWRGYYDKLLFSPTGRYLLANEVDFEHRSPRPDDMIGVGMIDLEEGDRWIDLGRSSAWNWQQGCMLQWLPGTVPELLWNDRDGDRFVCRFRDATADAVRTIPHPIYCVSPDGTWGLTTDFRRLNDMRPGYGYAGLADPHRDQAAPTATGLWRVDLRSGEAQLLFSYADVVKIPHPAGYSQGAKHWFNHLLIAPDGKRFIFLHRWRGQAEGKGFATRMFTANADGSELHVLDPHGKTSHFVWRDPDHVLAWAWHPSHGERFYLYCDRTDSVEVVGKDHLTRNGHVTYLPGTGDSWLLNDCYPDRDRNQHPHLFHIATGKVVPLGAFRSPQDYTGEWRCDMHPAASRDGRLVAFDSPHQGGRQVYVADVSSLTRAEVSDP